MTTALASSTIVSTSERVERLSRISAKRVIDPDVDLAGGVGDGQVLADELLSVHGLDLDLTQEQKRVLSREEVASILDAGMRFEAVLEAGFAFRIATARDLTDPRITYLLHEIGEETRHQRLFQRVLTQLQPKSRNPMASWPLIPRLERAGTRWITRLPAMLFVSVLGGEEIPDLLQKMASEHPQTDPFLAEVNRYHRQEEARHLSFAKAVLPEVWAEATLLDRFVVKYIAPRAIDQMFRLMVHPGVYAEVGLPAWETWRAANRTPQRIALRQAATRPVLDAVIDAGILRRSRIPKAWRTLCGVDASGQAVRLAGE
ncbi:MAG: diiron oxygenase [Acidimicrobiales bacterium]